VFAGCGVAVCAHAAIRSGRRQQPTPGPSSQGWPIWCGSAGPVPVPVDGDHVFAEPYRLIYCHRHDIVGDDLSVEGSAIQLADGCVGT
jgi:hypothetical protein